MKLMKAMHDRSNLALPDGQERGKVPQNQATKIAKKNKPGGANAKRIGGKKKGMVNKTNSYS
tara:strand:+ start:5090 stop:5275 length:186 start_codon:yes stop_codon:yes gene_type:complete